MKLFISDSSGCKKESDKIEIYQKPSIFSPDLSPQQTFSPSVYGLIWKFGDSFIMLDVYLVNFSNVWIMDGWLVNWTTKQGVF